MFILLIFQQPLRHSLGTLKIISSIQNSTFYMIFLIVRDTINQVCELFKTEFPNDGQ